MSVEQYGARLLDEVHEESLDELLKYLRAIIDPTPKDLLGFPQVDKLLELFRYHERHTPPRRPGWTTTSYPGQASSDDESDDNEEPDDFESRRLPQVKHRPPVIEITSTKSAAGKTTILYQIAALALLSHVHGSRGSAVVWFDTDNSFSATRIAQVASRILTNASSKPISTIEDTVTSALRHLYILKPTSSTSLINSLHALSSHLLTQTSQSSPNRPLALLIVDAATAFSYQDRFDADIARLEAGPGADTSRSSIPSRTSQIIIALRHLQQDFECSILFTTVQQTHTHHQAQTNRLKRPLPSDHAAAPSVPAEAPSQSPWTAFATLSLSMSRIPVAQFAPNMTLDECLRDREKRQEAVAKGRFAVGLNWEGSGMWPPGVRDVVNGMEGRGGFVVRITEKGMDIE